MYDVAGKTAVVTGAASGIGLGIARALARAGMSLVMADVEPAALDGAVDQLRSDGYRAVGVLTDVSDRLQVEALAEAALAEFGAVHVVANNAGVGASGPVEDMSIEEWKWIIDVNLWGVIHGVRTFLPILKRQDEGHITATSSVAGLAGGPMLGAYHTAKHGVVGLMDSVRAELALLGSPVKASVLCPGPVATNVVRSERNRPDDVDRHLVGETEKRFWSRLTSTLAAGMAPEAVGELVADAVRLERFWILTEPEQHISSVEQRLAEIKADHLERG